MSAAGAIRQTTTTTGTGNLTLASVSGFATFAAYPAFAAGGRFPYIILDDTTLAPIEEGWGYLSGGALVREKVLCSYSSGVPDDTSPSAVSLAAGTKRVLCAPLAGALPESSKGVNRNASLGYQRMVFSAHLTVNNASSASYTIAANRLVFTPFKLDTSLEVDAVAVRVGTGAASTNVRMGIYDVAPDGHAGALLAETGSVSSATSGVDAVGTLTGGAIRLNPGWYYLAVSSDGAPTLGRISLGGELYSFLGPSSGNLMQGNGAFYATATFGAMPNPAPSTSLTTIGAGAAYPTPALRAV